VLAALDPGLAADTLQEMEDELAAAALQEMPVERAVTVLEKLETDEAADLLGMLPDELSQELLARLPDEREEDLRELASHPEHSAGALMTTDLVTMPVSSTAGAALEWIRRERPETHAMRYLYFVEEGERLAGVASLRDVVLAEPDQPVAELMEDDVVTITADLDEEEVGRIMTKYDLLAIPVVDAERRLLGIVTLDDALDAVLPEDWKQRLPRLFR
jgi:magnesium transporter